MKRAVYDIGPTVITVELLPDTDYPVEICNFRPGEEEPKPRAYLLTLGDAEQLIAALIEIVKEGRK